METALELKNLTKGYGDLELFQDFSISFHPGAINCILGPSGCGKTTLLNIISGLLPPDKAGYSSFPDKTISCVFQEPRLLPWKTVKENLIFTLKDKLPGERVHETVNTYLEMAELKKFSAYYPHELSGGMKQRLSLARAFSFPSDIILMDEPFKALDIKLKKSLMERFHDLWDKDRRTVIFVTHEIDEVLQSGNYIHIFSEPPVKMMGSFVAEDNTQSLRKKIIELLHQ